MGQNQILSTIQAIREKNEKKPLSIGDIVSILGVNNHLLFIGIHCLPFIQPIPVPGLSLPFGIIMLLALFTYFMGWGIWLPKFVLAIRLSQPKTENVIKAFLKKHAFIEKYAYPRQLVFVRSRNFKTINYFLMIVNMLLLIPPILIPFNNSLPSSAIITAIIGTLEEDGMFILISYLMSTLTLVYYAVIWFAVNDSLHVVQNYIQQYFH